MKLFKFTFIIGILLLSGLMLLSDTKNGEATNLKFGLDIVGGAQLKFQGLATEQVPVIDAQVMQGVEKVIANRVNASGTTEAVVQRISKDRILVEIPGANPDTVKRRLLKTANLEFRELDTDNTTWVNTGITGADLKRAQAAPNQQGSSDWVLLFEMKPEGAKKFSNLTSRLLQGIYPDGTESQPNMPLAIFLDNQLISQASVKGQISTNGQISGKFSQDEAIDLALQLNAGALPIPLKLIEERTVSPTLGQESLQKSLFAGLFGLAAIALYMIGVYRLLGLLSTIALTAYVLISLGLFTNMVTLSSAGIAGFILSIGMAVDANILIFERIKEEIKSGKGLLYAVEEGFNRAFPSIFDSNLNTLLICTILLIFGTGLVKGFAITLAIGVIVSFISAIVITRALLDLFLKFNIFKKPVLYGVNKFNA